MISDGFTGAGGSIDSSTVPGSDESVDCWGGVVVALGEVGPGRVLGAGMVDISAFRAG